MKTDKLMQNYEFRIQNFKTGTGLILLCFLLLNTYFVLAQQIELKGSVTVHNSKYETGKIQYVKDAFVSAPFSKPANTDDKGNFSLEFVGMKPGTSVPLTLEKQGLEVVNARELQQVVINRKLPLRVFVAERGKLVQAQTELYQISREGLFKRKDAMITRLRADNEDSKKAIAELEKRFNQKLANRFEAEQLLNTKIAELERRLPEFAAELAAQNLDFASDLYIEAYEEFKKGNIEKTIEILDSEKLEASYAESRENLVEGKKLESTGEAIQEKSLEQMDEVIRSYELKAEILSVDFRYGDVAVMYEKLIAMQDSLRFNNEILAMCYEKAASAYFKDGNYQKTLDFLQREIGIRKDSLDTKARDLANAYRRLGNIHNALGKYSKALDCQEKAVSIWSAIPDKSPEAMALLYRDMGDTRINLKKYGKALKYYKKSLKLWEENPEAGQAVLAAAWYGNGMAFLYKGKSKKALHYLQTALDIRKKSFDTDHPDLAQSHSGLAAVYLAMGNDTRALDYQQKAIKILRLTLREAHPDIKKAELLLQKIKKASVGE